jgi:imidazolonepropionase-like amidohydrolase
VLTPGVSVDFASLAPEELEAAVEEAHSWGVPIAAHAHGDAGARRAVQAGVDSVEHGSLISAQTVRMMKERGTFHVATISAHAEIVGHGDEVADYVLAKGQQIIESARASFERALRAGVRHAVGTDAGTPFNGHGHGPLEMVRMADWGMPPAKVLVAATSNAAALCRVDDETGTVEAGKAADLVLYEANPLEDVRALLSPAVVFRGGERYSGRPVG